jgi:hypothetical protein
MPTDAVDVKVNKFVAEVVIGPKVNVKTPVTVRGA